MDSFFISFIFQLPESTFSVTMATQSTVNMPDVVTCETTFNTLGAQRTPNDTVVLILELLFQSWTQPFQPQLARSRKLSHISIFVSLHAIMLTQCCLRWKHWENNGQLLPLPASRRIFFSHCRVAASFFIFIHPSPERPTHGFKLRPVTVATQRKAINHATCRKCFPTTPSNEGRDATELWNRPVELNTTHLICKSYPL